MTLTKIALVGANGKLGPSILNALLAAQTFDVTVLTRQSSQSTYPPTVHISHVSNDPPIAELTTVLKGQDAVVVSFAGSNDALQIRYADAAAAAGVRRFIPADFGSCDSSSDRALELVPLYRAKARVRRHLQSLSLASAAASDKETTGFSWTSVVCGHFFDWGLTTGFLQYDLKARKATVFDGGNVKFSASTLDRVALATVRCLQREEQTRDRMLFVQSLCVTQNEVLAALRRITPRETWRVEHVSSDKFIGEVKDEMERDPKDAEAVEKMVAVVGIVDSNWEGKKDFANSLLGLESEDLDSLIKKITTGHL